MIRTARPRLALERITVALGTLLGLVLLPAETSSQITPSVPERFNDANAAFAAGNYREAVEGFSVLLDEGHISTAILFDLANAQARAGNVGEAVLAYERALSLSPRNPDVLTNLRHVRAAADLSSSPGGFTQRLAATLSVDEWAWLGAAALWAGCLLLASHGLRKSHTTRMPRPKLAGLAFAALLLIGATWFALIQLQRLERGIVVGDSPGLREAPFDAATVSVDLSPGEIVRIERVHGDFVLARNEAEQSGWIHAGSVRRILPP